MSRRQSRSVRFARRHGNALTRSRRSGTVLHQRSAARHRKTGHPATLPFLVSCRIVPFSRTTQNNWTVELEKHNTLWGRFDLLVGALNVSSISTSVTGEIRGGRNAAWTGINSAEFVRGQEFARFNLGSTVILALPRGSASMKGSRRSCRAPRWWVWRPPPGSRCGRKRRRRRC